VGAIRFSGQSYKRDKEGRRERKKERERERE